MAFYTRSGCLDDIKNSFSILENRSVVLKFVIYLENTLIKIYTLPAGFNLRPL